MQRSSKMMALAAMLAAMSAVPVTNADAARWSRGGGHWGHHGGGFGRGLALGLGGAILGGALAGSYYYGRPRYYGYSGYYDYDDYDYGPTYYYGGGYGGGEARCRATFRSYDPSTGTYTGYDGLTHRCPYL